MRRLLIALSAVTVLGAVGCTPTEDAGYACATRDHVAVLTGTYTDTQYKANQHFPAGGGINALDADWVGDHEYPFYVTASAGPDVCVVGGEITGTLDHDTTTWSTWHGPAGFITKSAGTDVIAMSLDNVGDGYRFGTGDSSDWSLRGVRATRVHDDCVENDQMHTGLIDDALFDGCYVFYSSRADAGSLKDGSANTVTITNTLVWMEPMPHVYNPTVHSSPGHGPVWKMGNGANGTTQNGIGPQLAIHDTIIRIDQDAVHGTLGIPSYDDDANPATPPVSYLDPANCSGNTIVWLGGGTMPGASTYPSSCFTITDDIEVWNDAVEAWEEAHDF